MSTDPVVPESSSSNTIMMENGNTEGGQPVASTSTAIPSSNAQQSTNVSSAAIASRMKVDGLAVTMDGREEEADDCDMIPSGKTPEEQQDAAAQDLDKRRQSQLRKQNRFTKTSVLIPPENFAIVEDGLYRSGQPTELNFPFLQRLGLRSLIWLAPEEPHQRFLDFLRQHHIQLHHLGVLQATNAWDPITEEVVLKALDIILQPSSYPLMVMCNLGRHRTGTVIGCLRKLQRWNLASIFEEYRRHAGAKVRVLNEQFIELFDTDLVHIPIPSNGDTSLPALE